MRWQVRHRSLLILALTTLSLLALEADAQRAPGRIIRGQVLDENNKAVESAVVHLTRLSKKETWSVVTDKEGRYQFNDVSKKDDFELYAEAGERKSKPRRLSQFDTRELVFIHFKLEPAKKSDDKGKDKKDTG